MKARLFLSLVVGLLVIAACGVLNPKPEIVGRNARDGFSAFDYVVWVDCTVRNTGREGNIEVVAELNSGGSWIKRDTVFLAKDQERLVSIMFPEPELLTTGLNGATYQCSASAK